MTGVGKTSLSVVSVETQKNDCADGPTSTGDS